jgi:penicillin G amidase
VEERGSEAEGKSSWRRRAPAALALALAAVAAGAALAVWLVLRASLPQLAGERRLPGLAAEVTVDRDALGAPTVRAENLDDATRALGFLHAQERFFQMDLLRRKSAGELAALLGRAALESDRGVRRHGFRTRSGEVLAALPEGQRRRLTAYAEGANAGLAALGARPWEYLALRVAPEPWRPEDSLLAAYTLWIDLQDEQGRFERTLEALQATGGTEALESLAPWGDATDAPLDGSVPPPPRLPPPLSGGRAASTWPGPGEPVAGSNAFAVAGRLTRDGGALLAGDMHLGMPMPPTFYRVVLHFRDSRGGERRVAGVTLPGVVTVSAGSNGRVAWTPTNAYVDTVDLVPIDVAGGAEGGVGRYRTPEGWEPFRERTERIGVRGEEPVTETVRVTRWGPVISGPKDARLLAVRWNAHDTDALNVAFTELMETDTVDEALAVARRAGMPNQNLLLADAGGRVAWTVAGRVPRRTPGFDGRLPGDWAGGGAGWTGWLTPDEVPVVRDPTEGLLWSANQRHVGGEALRRLGDNGYDHGFRAGLIRDRLRELAARGSVTENDLLSIQLEDTARHFEPWRALAVRELEAEGSAAARELAERVRVDPLRAQPDSVAYRAVRTFRLEARQRLLAPRFAAARAHYPRFNADKLHTESLVLELLESRRAPKAGEEPGSAAEVLRAAVRAVLADATRDGRSVADYTWGAVNRLEMRHPLSRAMPAWVRRWIDAPSAPVAGDEDLPRNQKPRHGVSQRLVVSPGHEDHALFHQPGGQSGHPLSAYYLAGHEAWLNGEPAPLLPGESVTTLRLRP